MSGVNLLASQGGKSTDLPVLGSDDEKGASCSHGHACRLEAKVCSIDRRDDLPLLLTPMEMEISESLADFSGWLPSASALVSYCTQNGPSKA